MCVFGVCVCVCAGASITLHYSLEVESLTGPEAGHFN